MLLTIQACSDLGKVQRATAVRTDYEVNRRPHDSAEASRKLQE
jgi:hypothetical protein